MEADRVASNLPPDTGQLDFNATKVPASRQPKRRFVGPKTAAPRISADGTAATNEIVRGNAPGEDWLE